MNVYHDWFSHGSTFHSEFSVSELERSLLTACSFIICFNILNVSIGGPFSLTHLYILDIIVSIQDIGFKEYSQTD